jgi:hypothetical protein
MGASTLDLIVTHGDAQSLKDKSTLKSLVSPLLKQHKYAELDKLAESIRSAHIHYPDGRNKLELFYDGLEIPKAASEADWNNYFTDLKEWMKQSPESITAPAALVSAWTSYAWKARGGGYSDSVKEHQWQDFSARLKQGHQILDQAKAMNSVCPHLYVGGQTVALGESWERPEYDKLYTEAITKFPDYYENYFRKTYYLQPRWDGGATEWADFAEKEADKVGGVNGDKLYALLTWYVDHLHFYHNLFTDFPNLKWARVQKGMEAIIKEYPNNNYVLNEYCLLAYQASKKVLAKKLITQIGNNVDVSIWTKKANFLQAKSEILSNPGMSNINK